MPKDTTSSERKNYEPPKRVSAEGAYNRERALLGLLILSGLFLGALVVCNLVVSKFIDLDLGLIEFKSLPVGILPYPLTFLVTDVISEIYGRKRANQVVLTGFFTSVLVVGVVALAMQFESKPGSIANTEEFAKVFGSTPRAVFASMVAYLIAQFVDVRLFHFWKRVTKGRHLWFRNNASTITSQLLDSTLVICVLFWDTWTASQIGEAIWYGWLFKMIFAAADTPLCYAAVYGYRHWLRMDQAPGTEAEL